MCEMFWKDWKGGTKEHHFENLMQLKLGSAMKFEMYIQPKKGHTHPHPLTSSQKKVTLTHTYPHPAKKSYTNPHTPTFPHIP